MKIFIYIHVYNHRQSTNVLFKSFHVNLIRICMEYCILVVIYMSCVIVLILDSRSMFLASGSNGSDVHVHDLKHIVDGKVHVYSLVLNYTTILLYRMYFGWRQLMP
jgi:hypothetical protein